MGDRIQRRERNMIGGVPRLSQSMAGVTDGWGLGWNGTGGPDGDGGFEPVELGGGGGAPTGASYVVVALSPLLTSERRLQGTTGRVTLTDGGPNADLVIDVGVDVYRAGGTDVPIGDGGTGQSTKAAAFDALAPTTVDGDIVVRDGGSNTRLPAGTAGQVLTMVGGVPAWAAAPIALGAIASQWILHAFAAAGVVVAQTGTLT